MQLCRLPSALLLGKSQTWTPCRTLSAPSQHPLTHPPAHAHTNRYGRNWLKLRALGLMQYHSVLLVDADVAFAGPLAPLFALPTEFAAVWDQSKWLNRWVRLAGPYWGWAAG